MILRSLALSLIGSVSLGFGEWNSRSPNICRIPPTIPHGFGPSCPLSDHEGLEFEAESDGLTDPTAVYVASKSFPDSDLWTYPPYCMSSNGSTTSVCVFTASNFAHGRGISIIASPQTAQSVASIKAFREHRLLADSTREQQGRPPPSPSPPYVVQELPGRGFGAIANLTLHRGDRVMAHPPILATQDIVERVLQRRDVHRLHHLAVERLSKPVRDRFMALHANIEGEDAVFERIETNAFRMYDFVGVFPETARLNHDCRPNSGYFFDKDSFTQPVQALRTIRPGEEITISYVDYYLTHEQRAQRTLEQWGFKCACSLCNASQDVREASDGRLHRIIELEGDLEDLSWARNATSTTAELLISLYQEEGLYGPLAKAYRYAALEHAYEGKRTGTRKYASLALDAYELWEGGTSQNAREMRLLMDTPKEHSSWLMMQYAEKRQ